MGNEGAVRKGQENSAIGGKVLNAVIFGLIIWILIIYSGIFIVSKGFYGSSDDFFGISIFMSPTIAGIINYYYTKNLKIFSNSLLQYY